MSSSSFPFDAIRGALLLVNYSVVKMRRVDEDETGIGISTEAPTDQAYDHDHRYQPQPVRKAIFTVYKVSYLSSYICHYGVRHLEFTEG